MAPPPREAFLPRSQEVPGAKNTHGVYSEWGDVCDAGCCVAPLWPAVLMTTASSQFPVFSGPRVFSSQVRVRFRCFGWSGTENAHRTFAGGISARSTRTYGAVRFGRRTNRFHH